MLKSKTAFYKLQIKNPGGFIVKELYLKRIFKISSGDNRMFINSTRFLRPKLALCI